MAEVTRRQVVQGAMAAGVGLLAANVEADSTPAASRPTTRPGGFPPLKTDAIDCKWIDTKSSPDATLGTTWGVPWARGLVKKQEPLSVMADGKPVATQSWPTAYWPDGSVKWSAVAVGPDGVMADAFVVTPGAPKSPAVAIKVSKAGQSVDVDTGVIRCTIAANEKQLITSVRRGDKEILKNGRLVALRQDAPEHAGEVGGVSREAFGGVVREVTVEQDGPVRAVVKLTGTHAMAERQWLPFVVRLYFYAGSDVIRVMHSFVYDADEYKDFICGLGVRFDVPMTDAMHNRHVRFVGQDDGMFYEAVRTITGLRRDPGPASRTAQADGKATSVNDWAPSVSNNIERVPAWGDFTLSQLSADGFQIRKRTKAGLRLDLRRRRQSFRRRRLCRWGDGRRRLLRHPRLLAEAPRAARHPRRRERHGPGDDVARLAGRAADGPAHVPRRHGHGDL